MSEMLMTAFIAGFLVIWTGATIPVSVDTAVVAQFEANCEQNEGVKKMTFRNAFGASVTCNNGAQFNEGSK